MTTMSFAIGGLVFGMSGTKYYILLWLLATSFSASMAEIATILAGCGLVFVIGGSKC